MKLFNTIGIREWDKYTIENEPIASIDLMERASMAFTHWFCHTYPNTDYNILVVCGPGNNGGDGLAIARLLRNKFYNVEVFLCGDVHSLTEDCKTNLDRLYKIGDVPIKITTEGTMPDFSGKQGILIDALFGSGVNRILTGWYADLVNFINTESNLFKVSVDLPSGMPSEGISEGPCIAANHTCTFQIPKLSFFRAENEEYIGKCSVIDIGLSLDFSIKEESLFFLTDKFWTKDKLRKRKTFDHKGSFGHVAVIAGSKGKSGAAILTANAAIKSGSGLITAVVPDEAISALNARVPEIMTLSGGKDYIVNMDIGDLKCSAVAVGPGLGTLPETVHAFEGLLLTCDVPLVLDADALNIIAVNKRLLKVIKPGTVITPHPGEFDRLFGPSQNSQARLDLQIKISKELGIVILLKGAYTSISNPFGQVFFNASGNPGMATAGSGDVLTGIIGSLSGQGYTPFDAAVIGAFLHGLAGDLSLKNESMESLIASDIIQNLGPAFRYCVDDISES